MKAIICLLMLGSNIAGSDALLSKLLGDSSDKNCTDPQSCSKVTCFRNLDGSCNNVNKPAMGMAGMPYGRLCHDCYSDGKWALPKAKSGGNLPNARRLSYELFPEKLIDDPNLSQLVQQYGQFIAHDFSSASGVDQSSFHLTSCCYKDENFLTQILSDPRCEPIVIQDGDPAFNRNDTPCFELIRTLTTHDKKCHSPYSSYTPISDVTAWLDLSMVYGNSAEENKKIREFKGGRLAAVIRNGQEWPPQETDSASVCSFQAATEPCYLTGDDRANQSPQLILLHIVVFREHNRLCKELSLLNPGWDDEKTFQVARRIIIAMLQHITYYHYLPALIGNDAAIKGKLIYPGEYFVNDYDSTVDVFIVVEFASAAFRFFHSMVRGDIGLIPEDRQINSSILLRNSYLKSGILEKDHNFQDLTRGLANQKVSMSDQYYSVDITQFLLSPGDNKLSGDLRSLDTQRSRDHGVCRYVDVRKMCGLPVPKKFSDLLDYGISQENVDILQENYFSIEDLELVVLGAMEPNVPGTRVGITNMCVITKQFFKIRTGDRYFYQNGQNGVSFTLDQLKSIQRSSMSRMFCDNVEGVKSMQPNAFRQVSQDNPLMPCEKLPCLDLQYWKNCEC